MSEVVKKRPVLRRVAEAAVGSTPFFSSGTLLLEFLLAQFGVNIPSQVFYATGGIFAVSSGILIGILARSPELRKILFPTTRRRV